MPLYQDEGVVLRTAKLGEADRILTLLTRDHGKVRAVAKGVRRTKSRKVVRSTSCPKPNRSPRMQGRFAPIFKRIRRRT